MSSSDDPNPPLYDALWSLSGLTARHQLREDPAMNYPQPPRSELRPNPADNYEPPAGHVYGADDTPGGPPAPPLGEHYTPEPATVETVAPYPQLPDLVPCPCCGTGVHPDRLDR